jgi:RND family efflux transporter MFP subunit
VALLICNLSVALSVVFCVGCESTKPAKGTKIPKVTVTKPITDKVMDYQDFTGRLESVESIEIRARVSGYVVGAIQRRDHTTSASSGETDPEIPAKEGEFVRKGELLFKIEETPYRVEYNQLDANLRLAQAERKLMATKRARADSLWKEKAMSKEDHDTAVAEDEKSEAQVESTAAMKAKAKLYLDWTRVRAPGDGRLSRRFVDPGNLITADNTILTTIVAENLMYAYFDVDERTYLDLLASNSPGKKSWQEGMKFPVMMRLANEDEFKRVGEVDFVDNRVVANTGTVRMRGVFQNPGGRLKAGLFVRVRLPVSGAYTATLIPDEAIQSDQERKYVWVVNLKNEAEYRSVKIGQSIRGGTTEEPVMLRVLKKDEKGKEGLSLDERVIISGMQRVRRDHPVEAVDTHPPLPPESSLVRLLKKAGS